MTRHVVAQARALRRADSRTWTYARLASQFGCSTPGLYERLNPEMREARHAPLRHVAEGERTPRSEPIPRGVPPPDPKTLAARLREIPPDTRDLTQRFFGDPLPGRSALDQQRRQT